MRVPWNGRGERKVLRALREVEAGDTDIAICRKSRFSQPAVNLSKNSAGLESGESRESRQLREEDSRPKRPVAEPRRGGRTRKFKRGGWQ